MGSLFTKRLEIKSGKTKVFWFRFLQKRGETTSDYLIALLIYYQAVADAADVEYLYFGVGGEVCAEA